MADDEAKRPKDFHDRLLIWAKAASLVLIPAAIAFATIWIDAGIKHRQANTEMVRLAVGILQQDPEENQSRALREWSLDIVDQYSGVPLPESAREELLNNPLEVILIEALLRTFLEATSSNMSSDITHGVVEHDP